MIRFDPQLQQDAAALFFFPEAVSEEEQRLLLDEVQPRLRRKQYSGSHWDNVIVDYKVRTLPPLVLTLSQSYPFHIVLQETELLRWNNPACGEIIERLKEQIRECLQLDQSVVFLPPHVVDLSPQGYIQPHVDSVKFSGGFIAGLSLLSTRILRLVHVHDKKQAEVLVEPRSLYVLSHKLRYEYEHGILGPQDTPAYFEPVQCEQRISVMLRDAHPDEVDMYKRTKPESRY